VPSVIYCDTLNITVGDRQVYSDPKTADVESFTAVWWGVTKVDSGSSPKDSACRSPLSFNVRSALRVWGTWQNSSVMVRRSG